MTNSPGTTAGAGPTPPTLPAEPADLADLADLADVIAAAARSVPGVADLHTGAFGEAATYLPGRRVNGVQIRDDVTEVHLTLTWGAPVLPTADEVRRVVSALVTTRVDITVEDVVGP